MNLTKIQQMLVECMTLKVLNVKDFHLIQTVMAILKLLNLVVIANLLKKGTKEIFAVILKKFHLAKLFVSFMKA